MALDGPTAQSIEAWLACVEIPSFTLQLLLRERPSWREVPAVVVDEDKPLGYVVAVNSAAVKEGVRRGMRYATALSVVSTLQAGVVPHDAHAQGVADIIDTLQKFSPVVEHSAFDVKSFWVNMRGMERLYPDRSVWMRELRKALKEIRFFSTLAVGYSRFGTYIGAKLSKGVRVFSKPDQEERAVTGASIEHLPIDERSSARLHDLGVTTVGAFRELSSNQVRRKLGERAFQVHRFATSNDTLPLQAEEEVPTLCFEKRLQSPLFTQERLLPVLEELIETVLRHLVHRSWALSRLTITLTYEDGSTTDTEIRPAKATQERKTVMRLISLRLEALAISSGIVGVAVEPDWIVLDLAPGELFALHSSRNIDAGAKALALLRAELGEDAVCVARLSDAHFPEERFSWERLLELHPPHPPQPPQPPSPRAPLKIVRRILREPVLLTSIPSFRGGPYILTDGWWRQRAGGGPGRREYYYAEVGGDIAWIYHDVDADVWMIQGYVE